MVCISSLNFSNIYIVSDCYCWWFDENDKSNGGSRQPSLVPLCRLKLGSKVVCPSWCAWRGVWISSLPGQMVSLRRVLMLAGLRSTLTMAEFILNLVYHSEKSGCQCWWNFAGKASRPGALLFGRCCRALWNSDTGEVNPELSFVSRLVSVDLYC